MKRQRTLVAVLGIAVVALVVWRCRGRDDTDAAQRGATTTTASKSIEARVAGKQRPDPKTLSRGMLAGTVTEEGKTPIAHARVCADGRSRELADELLRDSVCAETDAQGRYTIANLLPAKYTVSASAKTYRPGVHRPGGDRTKSEVKLAAGEHKSNIDIALRPGGVEVTGVVADLTGGPIGHAKVWARASGWNDRVATTHGETDEQGRFSLWVKPGSVTVTAAADGYADSEETVNAPGKLELLLTPESSLSGIVIDAASGQPVEGARVLVGTSEWGWDSGETVFSDGQGKFRASRLTPGRYVAVARTEHGYGRTAGSTLVGLGQHVDKVEVKLFPAYRIEGKVIISATKAPCEDAAVSLRDPAKDKWLDVERGEHGEVVGEAVLPGTYSVTVYCKGFQSRDKYEPITVTDKDVTGLVWEVDGGARIRGKVVTKTGEPVEDASITAQTVGGAARDKTGWSGDSSARDGAYELTGLKPGSYKLEVSADRGIAPKDGYKVDVVAGATVEQDLVLDEGGTIKGTVVDSEGKPVSGVSVRAWPVSGGGMRFMSWGNADNKSDEAGVFAIDSLRPGEYRVMAQRGWGDQLRKPGTTDDAKQGEKVSVRANQAATVKLVVESQSGSIKGTVVDAEGKPVADAFVSAARESDAAGAQKTSVQETRWSWDERPNLTSTDGTFTVGKLSPGNYTVRAFRKGGGEAVAEHVAAGSTAKLQIKATGSITGVARRGGGAAPDELQIEVRDLKTGFDRTEKFFKTDGQFVIRDVPQGHFQIGAEADGGQKQIELELAEGEAKTGVVIELDALVTLTGRVIELGTAKPVPGMRMMAMLARSGGFSFSMDDEQDNVSDETGKFTIKNAPVGKLMIRGFPKDWQDSEHVGANTIKLVEGTGTIDIGSISVLKKRVKQGDPVGELGVRFAQQPPETPPDKREYKISFIDPAGAAAKTELKVGDVITSIDGIDVTGENSGQAWPLMRAPPGTKLALGLARNATVTVTLAAP